jgi:hypothetical protein
MGWLKLQGVVVRPQAETHGTQQPANTAAAAAARAAGFATQQPCCASSSRRCWDPWKADSAANVAYDYAPQPQPQPQNPDRPDSANPDCRGSGQQGLRSVGGGSAGGSGDSSQGLAGSEVVWDEESIPREWQWEAFAEEVGCPARCVLQS